MAQDVASAPVPQMRHEPALASPPERRLHQPHSQRHTYGALDLGTNNCRLLIARPSEGGFTVIDAFSRIVRLGDGLSQTGRLSDDAMDRAVAALSVCADKLRRRNVSLSRSVATEACRRAANGYKFVERVRSETGIALEIIEPAEEARLAMLGCHKLLEPGDGPALIFDIGGGSTEIAWLDGRAASPLADPCKRIRAWDSLPVGVVTLAERHGGTHVTRLVFEGMVEEVSELLADFALVAASASTGEGFHLLGTSGTVTTVGGIHLRLPRYDRRRVDGMWMRDEDITAVIDDLLETEFAQRAANPCIGRDRADLVLAGCAILEAIRRAFPSRRLRIADRGLREGILMNLMREDGVWRRGERW